jgi:hypothetical protein
MEIIQGKPSDRKSERQSLGTDAERCQLDGGNIHFVINLRNMSNCIRSH